MGVRIQSDDNGQLYPFRFVGALRCKVPNVILYDDRQIREIKAFCFAAESASVLSFDKTFNLGSIYVTPSVYKNTAVNRKRTGDHPIFLGPIFLHGHSDRQNYGMFFSHLSVLMMDCNQQALTLGSDDELALRHCMQAFFPGRRRFRARDICKKMSGDSWTSASGRVRSCVDHCTMACLVPTA